MTDLDLTAEQWRMARQAGASFTDESELEEVGEYGEQLALDGLSPPAGQLLLNVHTGLMACVIRTATRRKCWVTVRYQGRLTDILLDQLAEHWKACHADGSLL